MPSNLNFGVTTTHLAKGNLLDEEDNSTLEESGDILPEVVVGHKIKTTGFEFSELDGHTDSDVDKEENAHNEDDDPTGVHTTGATTRATTNAGERRGIAEEKTCKLHARLCLC